MQIGAKCGTHSLPADRQAQRTPALKLCPRSSVDRASACGAGGRRFKSCRGRIGVGVNSSWARHLSPRLQNGLKMANNYKKRSSGITKL